MEPISENLTELIAQKDRIASEVNSQSGLIAQIKTVLQQKASGEVPPSKLAGFIDGSLTEITASDLEGDTSIRNYAFCYSPITSITIPNSVTSIGSMALQIGSTTNKATIRFLGTTPPSIQSNTFDTTKLEKIIVPKGYGDTYKNATNWSNFADLIVESET